MPFAWGTPRTSSVVATISLLLAVACTQCTVRGFPAPKDQSGIPSEGQPTLWEAAKEGDEEVIFDLIEQGQSVEALDEHGWPALHWAARFGHTNCMELLMEAGADPNARLKSNGTTALQWAACEKHQGAARLLIDKGADVNMRDDNLRWIALHWAACVDENITRMLLDAGSDPSVKGRDGATALHMAASHGKAECIRALLGGGAVAGVQDSNQMSALHIAAMNGHTEAAVHLAQSGSDPNTLDGQCTALHYAAAIGDAEMIRALIEAGADPNIRGDLQRTQHATPLHVACKADSPEAVSALLEGGAWANLTLAGPPFGAQETPLHVASWRGFNAVVRTLIQEGEADVNATTSVGMTAIDYAAERGHLDTVRELENSGGARGRERDGEEEAGQGNTFIFGINGNDNGGLAGFAEKLIGGRKDESSRFRRANSTIKFDDVAGCDEAKEELEDVVAFLKDPPRFARLGGKMNRGILLSGAPGTGKTLLAKAVAGEAGVPFIFTSGSEFDEVYAGLGAARVRELFAEARKETPCIVFIDEIDAVGSARAARADRQDSRQTLNQILAELDGFSTEEGVLIIAATNMPDVLDQALLRPGRFDRKVHVGRPDQKGRAEIFKVHLKNVTVEQGIDVEVLARGTPGFTGADIMNMVNIAALTAAKDGKDAVEQADLDAAKDRHLMGMERRSMRIPEENKRLTAYHEGGHALVAALTPNARSVHKVTIVPRGHALGMVMQLPDDDETGRNRAEYLASIAVCMGGRAAEELIFGGDSVTDGCSSDLQQATELATVMVERFGMGRRAGVVSHAVDQWRSMQRSENLREELDKEVKAILSAAYADAARLLKRHSRTLHALTDLLMERGTLTGDELMEFLNARGVKRPSKGGLWGVAHHRSRGLLSGSVGAQGGVLAMARHLITKVLSLREVGSCVWEGCVDASYSFLMGRSVGTGGGSLALRGGSKSQDEPRDSKRIDALEREIRELKETFLALTMDRALAADERGNGMGSRAPPGEHSGESGSPSSGAADRVVVDDELKLRDNLSDEAHGDGDLSEMQ